MQAQALQPPKNGGQKMNLEFEHEEVQRICYALEILAKEFEKREREAHSNGLPKVSEFNYLHKDLTWALYYKIKHDCQKKYGVTIIN